MILKGFTGIFGSIDNIHKKLKAGHFKKYPAFSSFIKPVFSDWSYAQNRCHRVPQ